MRTYQEKEKVQLFS